MSSKNQTTGNLLPDDQATGNLLPDNQATGNSLPESTRNSTPDDLAAEVAEPDGEASGNSKPKEVIEGNELSEATTACTEVKLSDANKETVLRIRERLRSSLSGKKSNGNEIQLKLNESEADLLVRAIDFYAGSP